MLLIHGTIATLQPALPTLVSAAAVEVIAELTLEAILADRRAVTATIEHRLASAIAGAGCGPVHVTAINLPHEVRKMFAEVERARRDALAALERARGEHAALRVLANAARLIADNPALGELRLLQAIEASKGRTTLVMGASPRSATAVDAVAVGRG